ncbi:MAG: universal stress protein [Coleofasciculus chthonoplastes F1-TOW-03]
MRLTQLKKMGRRRDRTQRLLSDIRYKFITLKGSVPEEIVRVSQEYQVADIVMGKRGHQRWQQVRVGSVSQAVLETTSIPVILVEDRQNEFAVKSHNL